MTKRYQDLHAKARDYFPEDGNFMTPDVIKCGFVGPYAYELSQGRCVPRQAPWRGGDLIYGVTLYDRVTGERNDKFSKCCYSRSEADEWIDSLRDMKGE